MCFIVIQTIYYYVPTSIGSEHYEMMDGVCLSVRLSVCLSVTCLDRKGLRSPKLARLQPMNLFRNQKVTDSGHQAD